VINGEEKGTYENIKNIGYLFNKNTLLIVTEGNEGWFIKEEKY